MEAKRAVPRCDTPGTSTTLSATTATTSKSAASTSVTGPTPAAVQPAPTTAGSAASTDVSSSKPTPDEYAYHKIFVGGLHYDTREREFRSYFERYGRVVSAEVMFNRETHKSRGFGFIIFEKESSVDLVCEERDHIIDGKMVCICFSFVVYVFLVL